MLGYTKLPEKDENGLAVYVVNEEEAEIVRRIYEEFIAGVTVTRICRGLEADGIRTKLGKEKWDPSVIRSKSSMQSANPRRTASSGFSVRARDFSSDAKRSAQKSASPVFLAGGVGSKAPAWNCISNLKKASVHFLIFSKR